MAVFFLKKSIYGMFCFNNPFDMNKMNRIPHLNIATHVYSVPWTSNCVNDLQFFVQNSAKVQKITSNRPADIPNPK